MFDYLPTYFKNFKETVMLQSEYNEKVFDYLPNNFLKAKCFVIDEKIKELLVNTKEIETTKLPFQHILIFPQNLVINDEIIESIYIFNYFLDELGLYYTDYQQEFKNQESFLDIYYFYNNTKTDRSGVRRNAEVTEYVKRRINFKDKSLKENEIKVRCFVHSFLNFINNPEVKVIEHPRNFEQDFKRKMANKTPFPNRTTIEITGILKKYINDSKILDERVGCSYRFWVRGHFRNLVSKKYKKCGQKIWVLPYIKGSGILIDKKYSIKEDCKVCFKKAGLKIPEKVV
jgi:hypothetical protein